MLRQAPIWLFDEPTSSLDAKAERQLLNTVMEMARDKILLMVSHRFTTVQAADRIVVLSEGRAVESGTHLQLLQANGIYAALFAPPFGETDGVEVDPKK